MEKKIEFSIYEKPVEVYNSLYVIKGLSYSDKPVKMAFDSAIDSAKLVELFLQFSSDVAV
ncbi:MAG: hypothetical protein HGB11_02740, partial [Chlorobiales bacterium]|nr:hypothetical protein [Chlorobiales bacterium]